MRSLFFITSLLSLVFFTSTTIAQTTANTDADITVSAIANTSADAVWTQIRKMDNIVELSSFVGSLSWKGPKGVGGERRCTAPDQSSYYVERIEAFDDQARSYGWQVVEGVPAKEVHNRIRVIDLGYNRAMVVFTSKFEFMENPNMTKAQFEAFFKNASYEMLTNAIKLANRS